MSIISKETWDKFTQEEKEKIRSIYSEAKKVGTRNIRELEEFFGKEQLQPQPLTYEDVERELFELDNGRIVGFLCTSARQIKKLGAIYKLLNVTAYLNKDWMPGWSDDEDKWSLCVDPDTNKVRPIKVDDSEVNSYVVYFRTEELAKRCVEILGARFVKKGEILNSYKERATRDFILLDADY